MDEVPTEQILEPVLVRIVSVGTTVKVVGRRIFLTLLVMSILKTEIRIRGGVKLKRTYMVSLFIEHERGNGTTGVSTVTGLTSDTNSSVASAILILSSGNGARGRWHDRSKW